MARYKTAMEEINSVKWMVMQVIQLYVTGYGDKIHFKICSNNALYCYPLWWA